MIGTERNAENDQKYQKALRSGEMFYSQDCYLIGSAFVDSYVPDGSLEHTLLYLGACSSGKDSRLAQAFLNKGAEAVYANSGIIHTVYNLSMINGVAEGLCQTYEGGGFYTVSDALDYAKDKHGAHDTGQYRDTEVRLFTENQSFALDWYEDFILTEREVVLVLDTSGSMNGTPLSETKKAAENFIETVLKEDASIGLVTYASQAEQKSGFSRKQYMLTEAVDRMDAGGSTNIDGALQTAAAMLEDSEAQKKLIVLMSDGVPNVGREGDALIQYADEIRDGGVYIYTLGFFNVLSGSEKAEAQRLLDGIADEGCHYEVEDADDLVFFFGDIAAQINGQKYIYVKIACPVDVIVSYGGEELNSGERRLNTRTSYGSLSFEENDSSADGEDDPAKVLRLKEGAAYEIRIEGTGRGRMDYTIGFMDDEGSYSDFRRFENIRISRDTVIDTVAAVQKQTELRVDEDGDGRYDLTYRAGENERGEQVSYTPLYIAGGVAAASGLALLISLLVLISRIKKRLALRKACA